jgi:hypothetical protein
MSYHHNQKEQALMEIKGKDSSQEHHLHAAQRNNQRQSKTLQGYQTSVGLLPIGKKIADYTIFFIPLEVFESSPQI